MENSGAEKLLLAKAQDIVSLCERQYTVKALGFLTPAEAAVIKKNIFKAGASADTRLEFYGGFPDAERCLFAALPEYASDEDLGELISVLEISGRETSGLCHRDYLGSLLGLGIKREKIGDILVLSDKTLVFVLADIADYIVLNLSKIGRCGVKVKKVGITDAEIPKRRFEEIRTTVASLRLDCIIGAALKTSRSGAAEVIKSGRVSVNFFECEDFSKQLKPGDVFSVRGKGRFRLAEDVNETKKGRLGICIEKSV